MAKHIICCLVLAHKNLSQIERLCLRLNHDDIRVIVHLDKKMSVRRSDINRLEHMPNVNIHPTRHSCFLDEWSLVSTTLDLISYAKNLYGDSIKYFSLMSGQDYLLKPIDVLVSFLHNNYPQPFIDCTPFNLGNWVYGKFTHTKLWVYARKLKRITKIRGYLYLSAILEKYLPQRLFVHDKMIQYRIPLYGGSAWWILPDIIIDEIFTFIENNKDFIELFKWTDTPEETFFQTLSMQSTISKLIQCNPPYERSQNCLTYAHFERGDKAFTGHPHVLETVDFNWLVQLPLYIARKFDVDIDATILDKLDNFLDNYENLCNHNQL